MKFRSCGHLKSILRQDRKLIENSAEEIKKLHKKLKFETLAFTGNSGALFAPIIGYLTGIPLTLVRKRGKSHSILKVEGFVPAHKYIFVDDVIDTGNTYKRVIKHMKDFAPNAKCVGVLLYGGRRVPFLSQREVYKKSTHLNY